MRRERNAEPPLAVDILPMKIAHLADVYAIEVSAYPRPWPFKCFLDELTKNNLAYYIVAMAEGKVIGYAGMWLVYDEAHITNIAVSFGYRRRRVAEQMLVHLIDTVIRRNMRTMFLEVRRYNVAAQMLYTRYGFVPVQVRERYYVDNDEDAIVLRVHDVHDPEFADNFRKRRAALRHVFMESEQLK